MLEFSNFFMHFIIKQYNLIFTSLLFVTEVIKSEFVLFNIFVIVIFQIIYKRIYHNTNQY